MAKLSRRAFLKQTGLAGAALGIAPHAANSVSTLVDTAPALGRAFTLTDVYQHPDQSSSVIHQLAPDSVHPITASATDSWYRLSNGYVPRQVLQPIEAYTRPDLVESPGFWAEVVAPVSAIRGWCAGHAPIVTRLGYGAVVYVNDLLTNDRGEVWYGLAAQTDAPLIGWSNALHYAKYASETDPKSNIHDPRIKIDTRQFELTVYDGNYKLYGTRIYSPVMRSTSTTLSPVQPGTSLDSLYALGIPWLMQLDTGFQLYGAFWHNRFGTQNPNPGVELPPHAARWVYSFLLNNPQTSSIEVC
jgi:hypothetical protein